MFEMRIDSLSKLFLMLIHEYDLSFHPVCSGSDPSKADLGLLQHPRWSSLDPPLMEHSDYRAV